MNPAKAAFNKWWKDNCANLNATDSFKAFKAGWGEALEFIKRLKSAKKDLKREPSVKSN